MPKLIGSFVFKVDSDGSLTATWLNEGDDLTYPNAEKHIIAKKVNGQKFEGTYLTTWVQLGTTILTAQLKIKKELTTNKYQLLWSKGTKVFFRGEATVHNNLLIGTYWEE